MFSAALIIFVATLVLVVLRPRGLGIGWSAMAGASVAWLSGVVSSADIAVVWHIVWDATFTFVALIVISLVLDAAGFFAWAALHVVRWGRGRGAWLFVLVILLGAAMAMIFANDGAALLLTPIMIAILARLELPASAAWAFILATGFIADTASLALPISNLVNIVSANYFEIDFDRYVTVMLPVNLVSIGATLAVLWLFLGHRLPRRYPLDALPAPDSAIVDRPVCRAAFPVLGALLVAYFVLARWHVPFCTMTGAGAAVLLAVAARRVFGLRGGMLAPLRLLRAAPWQIVWFSIGMYLVVYGLARTGLSDDAAHWLERCASAGPFAATLATGFTAAGAASILNNLPATLLGALAVQQAHVSEATQELMIYANVIGNDLGPKFTPIGSLATLLWLHVLSAKGYHIGWGRYMIVGLLLTPAVLLATLVALTLWLGWLGPV